MHVISVFVDHSHHDFVFYLFHTGPCVCCKNNIILKINEDIYLRNRQAMLAKKNKLPGYSFPVFSTDMCPRSKTEYNERSAILKCAYNESYACLPNEHFTMLLEFCYYLEVLSIQEGICLFMKTNSKIYPYDCKAFISGCPDKPYFGSTMFEYPSCFTLDNGCFLVDQHCTRVKKAMTQGTLDDVLIKNTNNEKGFTFMKIALIAIVVLLCLQGGILFILLWVRSTPILYCHIDT
ncbi:uncharacterized protein LOC144618504 [Crassostrea virginica]